MVFKHVAIPVFGLFANLACMLFYLIGPFVVSGMSWHEPYIALGVAGLWGGYGVFYFLRSSKVQGKAIILGERPRHGLGRAPITQLNLTTI